jgi:hypothetical protein
MNTAHSVFVAGDATIREVSPAVGVLLFAGFLGVAALFAWLILRVIPRKVSGWDILARRFPAGVARPTGGRFAACVGFFRGSRSGNIRGAFLVECAPEGLLITANFARQLPILIPWSAIREVQPVATGFGRTDILVSVDFEKRMGFFLPAAALPELRRQVPPERVTAPTSLVEIITNRFRNQPANTHP